MRGRGREGERFLQREGDGEDERRANWKRARVVSVVSKLNENESREKSRAAPNGRKSEKEREKDRENEREGERVM